MKNCAALSRNYRLIWSRARCIRIAVSEAVSGPGKGSGHRKLSLKGLVLLVPLVLFPSLALAAPTGGQVVSGSGAISQSGSTTTINQSSRNLSLKWQSFNVGPKETVNFRQPNAISLAVNRISDPHGSTILGHLNANGQVWLINPNGILFGKSAQVNVGGLIASTLDTSDGSTFSGSGTGSVVNEGTINASRYAALLGKSVINSGVITAKLGTVAMGAGDHVCLTFSGDSLVKIQVNKSMVDSLVANHGLIEADGGMVVMNAGARDTLLASAVNNDGIVQARTVASRNGTITLLGGMQGGTVNVGGTLDASAPNGGNGGHIETSAAHVHVAPDARLTTLASNGVSGSWLIDPVDFTIAASGGDMTGTTLASNLSGGNVTIRSTSGSSGSSGNINVNDAVSWSANTLTLNAQNDINIKANLNGSGTAKLALQYGQSSSGGGSSNYYLSSGAKVSLPAGSSFSTKLGTGGTTTTYTVITSLGSAGSTTTTDLQGMSGDLAGNYALGADIDATATSGWNTSSGFAPVGTSAHPFTGNFAGLGHTISSLTINRLTENYVGLFGYSTTGTLRDVGLTGSSISGQSIVGALAGYSSDTIEYVYASGGSVTADKNVAGGLVGQTGTTFSISDSYATDSVTGQNGGGSNSTAIGGLLGQLNAGGSISNSYATGSVSGHTDVGGLVGEATGGTVSNSYATGAVSGTTYVGGLAGSNNSGGTSATYTNDYWDTTTSGKSSSYGGTGLATTQMKTASSFSGWGGITTGGGSSAWRIYDGNSYPLLRPFLTQISVTAGDTSKTYDGLAFSGNNGFSYSATPNSYLLGSVSYGGSAQGAVNAGSYAITPSGFYSTSQKGYDVSYADGTLTVNKAALNVTASNASKDYDGLAYSGGNGVSYSGFVHGEGVLVLGGTLAYGGSSQGATDVGSYSITPSGLTSSNYTITFVDGTLTISGFQPTVSDVNADTFALALVRHPQQGEPEIVNASPQFPANGSVGSGGGGAFVGQGVPMPLATVQLGNSATLNIVGGGIRLPSDSM